MRAKWKKKRMRRLKRKRRKMRQRSNDATYASPSIRLHLNSTGAINSIAYDYSKIEFSLKEWELHRFNLGACAVVTDGIM
ncbi:Ribosomal protein L41 [Cynara cardunculus var. scolymus]|uniref:60S ribosomal protein L41 n=1 Tax=Cynara cardunculus var. scolymus TaxID=59895 RepID=A0A103YDB3_CYNCS|nr:Ribosomal protein L41 [Cynara cardunculus var. scolymus]